MKIAPALAVLLASAASGAVFSFEPAPVLSIVSSERTFASSRRAIGMESEISIRHGRIINFDQACAVYCGQPKKTKNNF